jgi:hypothetical protein
MIANVMDMLFGCWHSNYSFPLTAKPGAKRGAAAVTGTYVVCLECGKEFPYDWKTMRVVGASRKQKQAAASATLEPEALVRKRAAA